MGGKVFTSGSKPLYTPRMALVVYEHVKKQCNSALTTLFPRAESPIEAPEKTSFGDIDILVSLEGSTFSRGNFTHPAAWSPIQKALRGVRSDYEARRGADRMRIVDAMSIAIPWPKDLSADAWAAQRLVEVGQPANTVAGGGHVRDAGETGQSEEGESKDRYVQVDVRLCDNDRELDWRLFKHNHGDLWNMLGHIIRPFGLTADETGLSIRIPEIEKENRKACRVFLTNSPTETLDFLGLSYQNGEWKRPFKSVDELFEYAASCKWFMLWPRETEPEEKKNEATTGSTTATHDDDSTNSKDTSKDTSANDNSNYLRKLKNNDRIRMKQRPLFARWMDEFVPRCREQGRFLVVPDPSTSNSNDETNNNNNNKTPDDVREEVRRLAFQAFPGSEAAYAATLTAWRRETARHYVKLKVVKEDMCVPASISRVLPAPQEGAPAPGLDGIERQWRAVLRSALARILIDDDEGFAGIAPPRLRDGEGVLVVDDVKDWINRNWEGVGRVAWEMQCARARAGMEQKRRLAEAGAKNKGDGKA